MDGSTPPPYDGRSGFGRPPAQGTYLTQIRRFSSNIVLESTTWSNPAQYAAAVEWCEQQGFSVFPFDVLQYLDQQNVLLVLNMQGRALPHRLLLVEGQRIAPSTAVDSLTIKYGYTEEKGFGGNEYLVKRGSKHVRLVSWEDVYTGDSRLEDVNTVGPRVSEFTVWRVTDGNSPGYRGQGAATTIALGGPVSMLPVRLSAVEAVTDIHSVSIRSRGAVAGSLLQLAQAARSHSSSPFGSRSTLLNWRKLVLDRTRLLPPARPTTHPTTQQQQRLLDHPVDTQHASADEPISTFAEANQAPVHNGTAPVEHTPTLAPPTAKGSGSAPPVPTAADTDTAETNGTAKRPRGARHVPKRRDPGGEGRGGRFYLADELMEEPQGRDRSDTIEVYNTDEEDEPMFMGTKRAKPSEQAQGITAGHQQGDEEATRLTRELSATFSQIGLDDVYGGCGDPDALGREWDGSGSFQWPITLPADLPAIDPYDTAVFFNMVNHFRQWKITCTDGWPRLAYRHGGRGKTGRQGWMARCVRAPGSLTDNDLWEKYQLQFLHLCPHLILLELQACYED